MKIKYMQEYIALVENLNFTTTANQLFLTQPALSKHIAIIEEIMGVKLLIRSTRDVKVTAAGQVVFLGFVEILRKYNEVIEEASEFSLGYTGNLTVGVPYYYSEKYMEPVVKVCRKEFPDIYLEVISYQPTIAYNALLDNEIDIALLTHNDYPKSELINFYNFATEPLIVAASTQHRLANRDSLKLIELEDETFIFYKNNYFCDYIKKMLNSIGFLPKKNVYSSHIDTLNITIQETNGISIMPESIKHMSRSTIKIIRLEDVFCNIEMCMAYKKSNNNETIIPFLKCVEQAFFNQLSK
jgi:DNA-binding transcriptional LysR family regulator